MSWNQLLAILKDNNDIKREEEMAETIHCPECHWARLKVDKDGNMACEICGWRGP